MIWYNNEEKYMNEVNLIKTGKLNNNLKEINKKVESLKEDILSLKFKANELININGQGFAEKEIENVY